MIRLDSVTFTYDGAASPALDGVSLSVRAGSFTCIAGAEGSGRTTLFRLLSGIAPVAVAGTLSGRIRVGDLDPSSCGHAATGTLVSSIFDDPDSQIVSLTAAEEVSFALVQRGFPFDEIRDRVHESLARVGLSGFESRNTASLSGGQKQRLVMASAIALRPRVLLSDEGSSALDPAGARNFFSVVDGMRTRDGTTAVVIERDLGLMLEYADQIVVLERGRVALAGTPAEVCQRPDILESAGLRLPAWLRLASVLRARGVLDGELPSSGSEAVSLISELAASRVPA